MGTKLKVLDLFSGIGGFSLGLERTGGFETVAFCEIDPFCRNVLKKHWPEVEIYEDVTRLKYREDVDLVTAGFPCQDISYAGEGAGITGERSGLFWYVIRTLCMVGRPKLLLENVAALLNRGLSSVLGALATFGYDAEWHCIPASAVGAPHRRDRIWIYGHPQSLHSNERSDNGEYSKREISEFGNTDCQADFTYLGSKRKQGVFPETIQRQPAFSWCEDIRSLEDIRSRRDLPEPTVCGTYDGLRNRLHALGNSVVPQIPEIVGHAIMEAAHD